MKTEKIQEKYQSELKWGSYLFISSNVMNFLLSFFLLLFFYQTKQTFVFLVLLNIFALLYCSYKCFEEIKHLKGTSLTTKLAIVFKVFIIYFLFITLINSSEYIMIRRENEIQITAELLPDTKSNLLRDFVAFLKTKK